MLKVTQLAKPEAVGLHLPRGLNHCAHSRAQACREPPPGERRTDSSPVSRPAQAARPRRARALWLGAGRAAGARTAAGSVRAVTCRAPCWRAGGSGSGRCSLSRFCSLARFPRLPSVPLPVACVPECVRGRGRASGGWGEAFRSPGDPRREAEAATGSGKPWTSRGCRRR